MENDGLVAKLFLKYVKSGLRGRYRISKLLSQRSARFQSVLVDGEYGPLWLDFRVASAVGLAFNPKIESGEDRVMKASVKRGGVAYDIGAHFGNHMRLLSSLAGDTGQVIAFEPNTELTVCLRKTVATCHNVKLFECGLSDRPGEAELFVPEDASMASLRQWTEGRGGNVHSLACKIERLDDVVQSNMLPFPDFIKCDVEGGEVEVFRGALRVLDQPDAPIVMFEANAQAALSFGRKKDEAVEMLRSLEFPEYDFFEICVDGITPLNEVDFEFGNIVAVPKNRRTEFLDAMRSMG